MIDKKGRGWILLPFLLLIPLLLQADQLLWMQKEQAEKAREFLQKEKAVVLHCGCCDADVYTLVYLSDVKVVPAGYQQWYELQLTGKGPGGSVVKEAVDLAYVHVKRDGRAVAVCTLLGFECDPCTEPFSWPDE